MDSIKLLTIALAVILGIMLMLLVILAVVYVFSKMKKNNNNKENNIPMAPIDNKTSIGKSKKYKEYRIESIMNFMEFDTVVDNMISQKDGMRYIMVVECQGINYDLMSEVEKNSVEEGFIQFLNTLRYPVQIYTQTRTVNLERSIQAYREKVKETEYQLEKRKMEYDEIIHSGIHSQEEINKAYFEYTKQKNLYDYAKDIIYNTEKMSANKNVLNKKYYVIIPYFIEELGDNNYDKQEQKNYAFSELYTRAQSVIRTLSVCGVNGRVLNSNELVELLYMAYNRDEAEVYGLDKALKAGYDELYSTAPDVVDKQMKALDKEIEMEAIEKAKQKVSEVKTEKQRKLKEKREQKEDLVDELARLIIKENEQTLGKDIAKDAIEKIDKEKNKEEGGTKDNDVKQEKPKRTRKTKTA